MVPMFFLYPGIFIKKELKGDSRMKRLIIIFLVIFTVFAGLWIFKSKTPSNRPDSYAGGFSDGNYWWTSVSADHELNSSWLLDPNIPDNYIPVPGKPGLYMVVDEDGFITGYKKGEKQDDGSWHWEDTNPDIPENYEAVPGMDNVYKVTEDDGSVRYFRYIRNQDDTYAFIEVDSKGNMIGETVPQGSEIPENYERVNRNQYAIHNDNGVVIGYKERQEDPEKPGEYVWVNINEPDTTSPELPQVGFNLTTDITGSGDVTGGTRPVAGFTESTGQASAVPTLMPSNISASNTNPSTSSGGTFVFTQPGTVVTQKEVYYITPQPVLGTTAAPSGQTVQITPIPNLGIPSTLTEGIITDMNPSGDLPSSIIETSQSGTYKSSETTYTQKQEGNALVTYAIVTESTYDADGKLISTYKNPPVEVSRQTNSMPAIDARASTLEKETDRVVGLLSNAEAAYNASIPNEMVQLLNQERMSSGLPALTFASGNIYNVALCRAAMMALNDSGNSNLPVYGNLPGMCSMYGLSISSPSENMLITTNASANAIHSSLQNSSASASRMNPVYTTVSIAIVERNGKLYICEIFVQ